MRTSCVCADMSKCLVFLWPPNIWQHVMYWLLFWVGKAAVGLQIMCVIGSYDVIRFQNIIFMNCVTCGSAGNCWRQCQYVLLTETAIWSKVEVEKVKVRLECSLWQSLRCLALETGISKSAIAEIMKLLKLSLCKTTFFLWRAYFHQPLLVLCVCVCVRAHVHMCVCARVGVHAHIQSICIFCTSCDHCKIILLLSF
jgi:hypothetical protein